MAGERPRKHVYSLEESSHSDGAEPAPSRKGFTKSQSLDSKKAPSGEKKSRRSPKSTPSSQKSSGGRGPVKVPKVGTPSKKGSPSRSARSKASPKRNLGGNSAHKTPTGARNRKPGSSRRGKRGSRSESEDSDGIKGEDDFIGKMPAKPLDAPSSDSESEKQRLEQKQRLKQGSKRPSPAPVGVPGPGPKRVVASAHDFPGYDGEPDADSDADDHVSDSDPDWAAANASQVERDRAAQRAERRLKRPAGRAQGKAPPAQPRSAPPAEDHPWDDFDDAADFNPEGEELGAGKQMQGTLPGGNHGAANLKGEVPWWTQAHTATLDSDRPDIARRNQLLWSRRGADGSESVSDWGPTGETSSDEESPGRKAGVQNGGRGLQREPQDRDAEWPRSEGLQRAAPDGLDLDEVVPETEEEDEPPAASDGAGLGGLCPGEDPGSARAANGQPPQGADADSEATLDADPAHRYGQSRVLGSGQRGGPVSAPGSNGHEMGPPNHSSEETESDERPRWREIMRAPRLDDPEEEPSNEADQDGTDLGQPDSIAGAATGPACDQLATRNQGPQGVPLVGPDDMTADDGVQGDAHLEGEPAVNSPEITGGPAATVGNGSPGGRQRRVVQPTGPEKGLAGGRSNGSWDNGNQERSTELQPGAAGGESDEEDSGNDRPPKRPRLDVAVAAVGPERQEPAGVGHGGSEVSRVAAASGSAATGNSNRLDGGSSDGARGDGSVPRPPAATGEGPAESSSGETGSEKSGDEGAPVHGLARAVAEASAAQVEGSGHAVTEAEGSESESQSSGDSSERTKRAAPTTAARGTGHVAGESSGSEGLSSGDSSVQTGANRADRRSTPRTKDTSAAVETVARDVVERTSSSDDSSDESASDEEAVEKGEGRALGAAAKEKAQSVRGNPEECADSEESPRTGEHAAAAAKQSTDSEESSDEEEPDTGQKGTATSARSGARGAEERGDVAAVESSGDEGSASDSEGSAQVNGDQSAGAGRTGETGTREGVEVERGGSGSESSEDESEEETLDGEEQPPSKGTPNGQAARTKSGVATGVPQAESTDEADSSEDDELDGDGAEAGRVAEDGRVNGRETAERHSNGGGGWGEKPGEVKESGSSSEEEDSEDESGSEGENEAAVATQVGRQLSETGKDGGQVSGQKRAKAATPDGTSEETSDSDDDERPDANATAPAGGVDEVQRHADTRAVESEKALRKTVATGSKATQSAAETSDSDDSASEAEDEVPAFKPDFSLNGVPSIGVLGGSDSDSDSGSESDVPRAESVTRETARREKGAAQGAPASRNGTPVRMIGVGDGPIQVPLNTAAAQDGGSDDSGESSSSDDSEESSSSDDSGDDTAFPQVPGEPPLPSFDLLRLSPALGPGASGEDSFHALLAQLWAKHVEAGSTHALHIQSVDTAGLARQPIRRFASLVAYVNSFRVWVLLEAWETIRAEYSAKKRSSKKRLKPPPPLELLDVCGVSDPGDGFSYLELTSRRDDSSNLPEKDEVALLEEVHFVDDSQPGFAGAAGHWQRAGKTVLAFAHYNIRKGTLKVRGAYRPASKVVSVLRVCSLTTLARSWVALYEMGPKSYRSLILDPQHWAPGAVGAALPPEQRARHQPRVTDDAFWSPREGPIFLHFLRTWREKGLVSDDQVEAMASGLLPRERLTLIQGPPGTGKTSTIVALVSAILVATPSAHILLCAPSNGAVDECTRRLLGGAMLDKQGKQYVPEPHHILRVGPPTNVHPDCLKVTMDAQLDTRRGSASYRGMGKRAARDKKRADVLTCAKVVCATLSGSGMDLLTDGQMRPFSVVIIDEAAQAVEPEALIALNRLGDGGRMILVGDPCQLPATVIQHPQAPYEVSLFERLQSAGSRCTLLTTQYRMHPAIRAFPSAHFYGDRLCDAVSIAARPLVLADSLSLECHPRDLLRVHSGDVQFNLSPYRFLDVRWSSEQYGSGGSTHNRLEASVVAAVVSGLVKALTAGVPVRDGDGLIDFRQFHLGGSDGGHRAAFSVGVITPYSAQRQLIGEELSRRGVPEDAYEVNTVDAFQGREMDAIVLSTVRAAREGNTGPGGTIGFVSDRRRMNVALTRARHCLLIVGDSQTLEARSEDWRQLIVDAKKRNCFEVVEKDGKSPGKVGPLRKGGGGPEDRSGGEGRGGGGSRQGAAKRQLDMGGGKKGEDELGGEKRKKLGGGLDGGVAGATKKRPEKAANGKRKELLGPAEKAEGITSVAAEPPKKKKKSSGKGDPQRGGLTGEGGSSAAEKGRSEAKDKEKKEGRKNGREKEETEKQTGRKGAATSGEGGKTENGLTEAAALLVTPPGGVKESRDNSPPKQSARGAEGPVSGGVDGQGGPVPHSILNRASSESETKSKVRMNVRLAKQVHFQEPGQLVQVRYIPRVKQEGAEDDGKEGPGKKPGRKRELTFQTFVDLKKGRKQWVGKAAPADGRLLKAGRNGSKVEGSSEGSKAKPGESPTTGAGSASRKDVLKQSGLKKTSRKGAAGQGALKGTLPLAAVVGKKK